MSTASSARARRQRTENGRRLNAWWNETGSARFSDDDCPLVTIDLDADGESTFGDERSPVPETEVEPDVEASHTVSAAGAGFGDPDSNRLVEAAAVGTVTDYLEARGYDITDVGSKNLGWDLTCVGNDGDIRRVEVKGVSGVTPTVLLTANEYRSAREADGWELAVVTMALEPPCLALYAATDAVAAATPMVYRVTL
ncbi:hypothetical protein M2359_003011 [Gordonia amarae]|uniref:Protein NO VEIN C-terminal domain-containing protein n=2 Tax=Gordonia amarae TaxID=36821 RepID=G7GKQ0_9ACTN|nr:DUF3883 domain-containing protein [Gordonia amarae]MCS3879382.1 hypothetical protein [Gordonia amarae]GAB04175.1 hypothetical protein GOAMR_14_00180 [Gordonia amarae NBRC 15530]